MRLTHLRIKSLTKDLNESEQLYLNSQTCIPEAKNYVQFLQILLEGICITLKYVFPTQLYWSLHEVETH